MMNVVALGLLLSSLVTAGVWSPSQDHVKVQIGKGGEDVIVMEGHRVVVVEYDPNIDGNTKILIKPHETHVSHDAKGKLSSVADDARETAKATMEDAKGKAKETIDGAKDKATEAVGGTRELVCDAFGKCKHKMASVMGRARDKASDAAHETAEKAHDLEEQAKDRVSEAIGRTKGILSSETEKLSSSAHEAKENVLDKVQKVGCVLKEAVDTSKTIGNDVAKNVTSKLGEAKDKVEEVKEEGERELVEIVWRGRELVKDVFRYVVSPRLVGSAMGVVHLLGFAMAYGMCVWVTFVSSYVLAGALPMQQFGMVQSKVYPVYFRILAYTLMVTLIGHLYGQRKNLFSNTVGMAQAYTLLGSFALVLHNLLCFEPTATKLLHILFCSLSECRWFIIFNGIVLCAFCGIFGYLANCNKVETVMFERMKMEKEEGRGRDSFVTEFTGKEADHRISSTSTPPGAATDTMQPPSRIQGKVADPAMRSEIIKLSERLRRLNGYSSILNILTLVGLTSHLVYLGSRLHVRC